MKNNLVSDRLTLRANDEVSRDLRLSSGVDLDLKRRLESRSRAAEKGLVKKGKEIDPRNSKQKLTKIVFVSTPN